MNQLKAIIFDMDGILFDTEKIYTRAWYEVGGAHKVENIKEDARHCVGLNHADTYEYFHNKYGKDFPVHEFERETSKAFYRILEEEGLPIKPGVKETLSYLKEKDFKIAVASSSRKESIQGHLLEAGFTDYFEYVIGGDMVAHSKPHPEIYIKACQALGVLPKDAIAVEDSYNGIKSAYAAGMNVVMIPDILPPTPEIERLLYKKFNDMNEFLETFIKIP